MLNLPLDALVSWFAIATRNATRALVCVHLQQNTQLWAWDIVNDTLTQVTFNPAGTMIGAISANGEWIYYHEQTDIEGGGHFFRMRFDGTEVSDLTPDFPTYMGVNICESYMGNLCAFNIFNQNGSQIFVFDAEAGGSPHLRQETDDFIFGVYLSHNGEVTLLYSINPLAFESYQTLTGQRYQRWANEAAVPVGFIDRAGDMRFAYCVDTEYGVRPALWNTRTGEHKQIKWKGEHTNLFIADISHDGRYLWANYQSLKDGRTVLMRYDFQVSKWETLNRFDGDLDIFTLLPSGEAIGLLGALNALPQMVRFNAEGQMTTPPKLIEGVPQARYLPHAIASGWWMDCEPNKGTVLFLGSGAPESPLNNSFVDVVRLISQNGYRVLYLADAFAKYVMEQCKVAGISFDPTEDELPMAIVGVGSGADMALVAGQYIDYLHVIAIDPYLDAGESPNFAHNPDFSAVYGSSPIHQDAPYTPVTLINLTRQDSQPLFSKYRSKRPRSISIVNVASSQEAMDALLNALEKTFN